MTEGAGRPSIAGCDPTPRAAGDVLLLPAFDRSAASSLANAAWRDRAGSAIRMRPGRVPIVSRGV